MTNLKNINEIREFFSDLLNEVDMLEEENRELKEKNKEYLEIFKRILYQLDMMIGYEGMTCGIYVDVSQKVYMELKTLLEE